MPLYPTSLMFTGALASALALTALVGPEAQVLRIIPACLALGMLFKFAYATLEEVADGMLEPPVPSAEMLGPSEIRPLLQLLLGAVAFQLVRMVGGAAGVVISGLSLLLLPASIGVLGATGSALDAINPLRLLRTARALGWYYLLIVAVSVLYLYAAVALGRTRIWTAAWYVVMGLSLLSVYSLIGGAIHVRRLALGFEPRVSPERRAAAAEAAHVKQRNLMLHDVFGAVRAGDSRLAVEPLKRWLAQPDADRLSADMRAVFAQMGQWNSERGVQVVSRCLIAELLRLRRPELALEAFDTALRQLPGFAPESEDETVALANHARAAGRRRTALAVMQNFVSRAPGNSLGESATALLRDLSP